MLDLVMLIDLTQVHMKEIANMKILQNLWKMKLKISLFWCKHFLNLHISGVLAKFIKNACHEKTA